MLSGCEISPLTVRVQADPRQAGRVMAILGTQTCHFMDRETQPAIGSTVRVAIARPVYARDTDGYVDYRRQTGLILRVLPTETVSMPMPAQPKLRVVRAEAQAADESTFSLAA